MFKTAIKLLVGVSLIVILVMQVDRGSIINAFKTVDLKYVLIGVMCFVVATVFEVLKLYSLLRGYYGVFRTARIVFIGLFMNNFLPTNVGGDAYKVYMLNKDNESLGASMLPVLLDRLTGLTILVSAGALYAMYNYDDLIRRFDDKNISVDAGDIVFVMFFLAVIFVLLVLFREKMHFVQVVVGWVERLSKQALEALHRVSRKDYMYLIMSSFCFHLFRLFGFHCFIVSMSGGIVWHSLILVMALVAVISALPISIGALGVREGVMVLGLVFFGVDLPAAIAVSLIGLMILMTKSLIGAGLFMLPADN